MICLRMQPGRIDKLEPATGPPDYIPRSLSRMAEVSNAIVEPLPYQQQAPQYYSTTSPWGTLLSSSCDEGLGVALAGHKRPRADVEYSSTSNWSELANLEINQARPWQQQQAAGNPLGEVVTRATESRSSPTGAAGYSSSPSWCSSDSGIQHSDICCKPYFSPPRSSTNPGTTSIPPLCNNRPLNGHGFEF